jgi:hypothetical protein
LPKLVKKTSCIKRVVKRGLILQILDAQRWIDGGRCRRRGGMAPLATTKLLVSVYRCQIFGVEMRKAQRYKINIR